MQGMVSLLIQFWQDTCRAYYKQLNMLSIYTMILDIIPIPSNVKYVLAKLKWVDICVKWSESVRYQTVMPCTCIVNLFSLIVVYRC